MPITVGIDESIGVNLYQTLGLEETIDDVLQNRVVSYEIKFYIQDNNSKWIDFSDRIEETGVNRLVSLANMTHRIEGREEDSNFSTTMGNISLDNHDGFFDTILPTTLKESGTTTSANFLTTNNYNESIFYRNKCKAEVRFNLLKGGFVDYTLGVFLIEAIETSYPFGKATITVTGLQKPLMETIASEVKNGMTWYKGAPISFLVGKLLEAYYNNLPSTWVLHEMLEVQTANSGEKRVLSCYGRPPTLKGTNLETSTEDITYQSSTKYTRAIAVWEWGTNASYGNGGTLNMNGVDYTNTVTLMSPPNQNIIPAAGDIVEIYGDTYGNNGFYTIASVTAGSPMTFVLKTQLGGTASGALNYHIHRIYMGIDNEIWYWIPKRDIYVLADNALASTYVIGKIWFNTINGKLYGVAWTEPNMTTGVLEQSFKFFKITANATVSWSSATADCYNGVINRVLSCSFYNALTYYYAIIGYTDTNFSPSYNDTVWREPLYINFNQRIMVKVDRNGQSGYRLKLLKHEHSISSGFVVRTLISDTGWLHYTAVGDDKHYFDVTPGYWSILCYGDDEADPPYSKQVKFEIYFSYGQEGCIIFCQNAGTNGKVFFFKKSSTYGQYIYKVLDYSDFSATLDATGDNYFDKKVFPIAGCQIKNTDYINFAGVNFDYTIPGAPICPSISELNNPNPVYFYKFNMETPFSDGVAHIYNTGCLEEDGDQTSSTPLSMQNYAIPGGITSRILYTSLFRSTSITHSKYEVISWTPSEIYNYAYTLTEPLKGLVFEAISATNLSRFIAVGVSSGSIYKILVKSNEPFNNQQIQSVSKLDYINNITSDDVNLLSNCTIARKRSNEYTNENASIVYGISAPYYPNETQASAIQGSYKLFKLENYISTNVALAEFEDMTIWEAITQLARACNALANFDHNGNFYFLPRSNTSAVTDTYSLEDDNNKNIISIEKNRAFDEIYNYCAITPYKIERSDTEFTVTYVNRADDLIIEADAFLIDYDKDDKIILRLNCVESGVIGSGDETIRPKWRWSLTKTTIETYLTSAIDGKNDVSTISLASVFGGEAANDGIHINYSALVTNPNTNAEIVMRITAVDADNNTIDWINTNSSITGLTGNASDSFPVGTLIRIIASYVIGSTASSETYWSDDGVSYLTVSPGTNTASGGYIKVKDGNRLAVGNYLKLSYAGNGSTITSFDLPIYLKISSIVADTNDYYVYFTYGDGYSSGNFSTYGYNGTTNLLPANSTIVKAYLAPELYNTAYGVGDTGIKININTGASTPAQFRFLQNDNILISNDGLKLTADEQSKLVTCNSASIAKYKRKDYPNVDNKFISRNLANELTKILADKYAYPKYILQLETTLDPTLSIINGNAQTRINIRAKKFFPLSPGYERTCTIREISHNFRNYKTSLVVKDVNKY